LVIAGEEGVQDEGGGGGEEEEEEAAAAAAADEEATTRRRLKKRRSISRGKVQRSHNVLCLLSSESFVFRF